MYSRSQLKSHVFMCTNGGMRTRLIAFAALCAFCAACIWASFAMPAHAYAKDYSMPQVNITADAQSDGTLHVVEQRTFDFHGDYSSVYWFMKNIPSNGSLQINSVSMQYVPQGEDVSDATDEGQLENLTSTPFNTKWRDSGGPGTDSYAVDTDQNAVYVFMHASDQEVVVQLDYSIKNGVQAYQDCADLYWQFIGPEWSEPSENVTCTITLPVPSGVQSNPGQNVYAWGHGPSDGQVTFNDNATTVTYKADRVNAGQFAEAHIVFPEGWLANVDANALKAHGDEKHLDTVLKDEKKWADAQHNKQMNALLFLVGIGVASIALVGWGIFEFMRHGKEHTPTFTDEYWRDVPDKTLHPAVMGRLYRWNKESTEDLTATIMHLRVIGAISIHQGNPPENTSSDASKKKLFGKKAAKPEYFLVKTDKADAAVHDPLDKMTMEMLFGKFAGGKDQLWLSDLNTYAENHGEEYANAIMDWQGQLTSEVSDAGLFEGQGVRWQTILIAVSVVYALVGIGIGAITANWWPLIFMIPAALILFIISNFMPRRSQKGCDDYARCLALRKWFNDFSNLKERPATDVVVWGELLIYAYLFGVADKVIRELKDTVPEMFDEQTPADAGAFWLPWYAMYMPAGVPDLASSFADAFDQSLANTQQIASDAGNAFSAGGINDGGFGGGFSDGGGFGFGGGGGGAR